MVSRSQRDSILLGNSGKDQLYPSQGEDIAYAHTRTASKGHIGMTRTFGRVFCRKMVGIKLLWLFPKVWVAMGNVGTPQDIGISGDMIPAHLIVLYCSPHQMPHWWIEPYCFIYNHACIVQLRKIFHCGDTPGQDLIKLGMQTLFSLRVLSK